MSPEFLEPPSSKTAGRMQKHLRTATNGTNIRWLQLCMQSSVKNNGKVPSSFVGLSVSQSVMKLGPESEIRIDVSSF